MPIDLSVVIVSYNTRDLLRECLLALPAAAARHSTEVIVVDNGSSDGSAAMVRQDWPEARVVEMGRNVGFAPANNRALTLARGRHLLLLNSDAVPFAAALDLLVEFLDEMPRAGVVAPRLLNADHSDQGTARAFPTASAAFFGRRSFLTRRFPNNPWSRRYLVGRDRAGDRPFEVDWVSGACLMVRRETVNRVGPLDEKFFMYWEDADWCRRIKAAGYAVYCVPSARVVHYEGQSGHGQRARLVWIFHRSVYRYFAKHHATGKWNLLRPIAAGVLAVRAGLIIASDALRARRVT